MEIQLQTVFVTHDRVALRWDVSEPVFEPIVFEVLRSGNAVTDFARVGTTMGVVFVDRVNLLSKFKPTFYRVRTFVGGHQVVSAPVGITNEPNPEVLAMQKRERFQLAKFAGYQAMLYPRRRTGKKCSRCTIKDLPGAGNLGVKCTLCYDTGFLGGYYTPVPIYICRQALNQAGANQKEDYVKESSSTNHWTSNWTDIDPEDVIREMIPPNTIWRVTGVQTSERRRAGVRQLLTVNEADHGSAIYQLPVPDFPWPDRKEIFWGDFEDGDDFENMFGRLVDDYVRSQDQDLRDPYEPTARRDQPQEQAGDRNPARGYSE